MKNPLARLNRRVGIDLGSSQTRIWVQDHGLVVDEPSLIAVNLANKKVLAVGKQAQAMQGRVNTKTQVFAPVQYPKLTDDALLKAMLKIFFRQVSQEVYFFSPTMLVALPSNIYPAMRQVLVEVLTELGASEVIVVDQTLAAAIGAGVPVADASGTFVLQLGASVAEATSFSMSKIVKTYASTKAGNDLRQEIVYWFKENQQLNISHEVAQKIQHQVLSLDTNSERLLEVSGLNTTSGSLQDLTISSPELQDLTFYYGDLYVALVKKLLANVPPSLVIDVVDKGLLLSGGLANLHGLELYLANRLGFLSFLVDDPDTSVINGVGMILKHLEEFRESAEY